MTADQWELVPDNVLRDGPALVAWIDARGLRRPLLVEIEDERAARRGMTKRRRTKPERQVLPMPTSTDQTSTQPHASASPSSA